MTSPRHVQLSCVILLAVLLSATAAFSQKMKSLAVYGGESAEFSFAPSPLKVHPADLSVNPRVLKIARTDEKGNLVMVKGEPILVDQGFDPATGAFKSELITHAIGITWRFEKAGIEFTADEIVYVTEKDGATVAFTEDGVRMEGIRKK